MKIVKKDNFDRDLFVESFVCENVNEFLGKQLVKSWNDNHWREYSDFYLKLVEDDYILCDGYKELMGE